jgi:transcriptional regulator with XRE-family HTH domain
MGAIATPNFHGRQLTRRLRELREELGHTQEQVGDALHMTLQKMSRIESGQVPGYHELQAMLDWYMIPTRDWPTYLELWEKAKKRRWWQRCNLADAHYVSLEDQASSVTEFQLGRIPALLQTEAYVQSANRNRRPVPESQTSDTNPFVLMPRQERLFGDSPLTLHALVHEPVLRHAGTDQEQLVQLLDRAQLPNVTVQVVPRTLSFHPGLDGSVILLGFAEPDEPDVAYAESAFGRIQSEDEHLTNYVRKMLSQLADDALTPEDTLSLLNRQVSLAE